MRIVEITDWNAPELDVYARLTEAQLRNRQSPENGLFIAESPKVILHALEARYTPVSLLMERSHILGQGKEVIKLCGGIPVYTGDSAMLEQLTGYRLTRGILCAMRRPKLPAMDILCKDASRIAVLENIVDPTNVGAVFRSAAALGIDAVLLSPSCCDPLHRRAVRVSMGTVFQVGWTYAPTTFEKWPEEGVKSLHELGFITVALALNDHSRSIEDPEIATQNKLAIYLGTEGDGLSQTTISNCDYCVRIPMTHQVDSLNVAAASAVAFWQLCHR